MQSGLLFLSIMCASCAAVGCVYLVVAIYSVGVFGRRRGPLAEPAAAVSVLKPLYGDEPGLATRLLSCLEQLYDGQVHMVCGVREGDDPAAEHVRKVKIAKDRLVDLVVSNRDHGPNRKISNLANMLDVVQHDVLVISDSDIEVGKDYLQQVTAHLNEENIGAVTCLYHGRASAGVWSRYEALAINSHFLPNVIVAATFGLAEPCCGSTIALRKQILEAIGGFQRFASHLADDHEIGKAVRRAGFDIAIPRFTVAHHCFSDSFRSLLAHELRVAKTVRCIDPVGYLGSMITHPFPLALAGAYACGFDAIMLALSAFGLRLILCLTVERAFDLQRQPYMLLPFGEAISFLAYCAGFMTPKITWRGVEFRVTKDGELKSVDQGTAKERGLMTKRC